MSNTSFGTDPLVKREIVCLQQLQVVTTMNKSLKLAA